MYKRQVPQPIPDVHFLDAQAMITAATGEDLSNEPDLSLSLIHI